MNLSAIAEHLWGKKGKTTYLMIAALLMLFTLLGARDIWTQEHRWADITMGMLFRHDFLHPYLGTTDYYDKPLLSYWLIIAISKVTGVISAWALRAPSALAGLLAVWSIYRLGSCIKDKSLGLLAGWLLLTTFYFLFWARTSSADMLNMAGSLFAVTWYFEKRARATFFDYMVFFLILSVTSLCKGLVGSVVPVLAVVTDICVQKSWKQHLRWPLFLAILPGAVIYLIPFWASSHFGGAHYQESGLYLVYRENVLRYFKPFDHEGPIYTYFLYLPIYILPWAFFFVPALLAVKSRWKSMSIDAKWLAWTLLVLFSFFTLSGSRRSYYILPVVPFAILFTADWIASVTDRAKRQSYAAATLSIFFVFLFLVVDILPAWYYSKVGVSRFANELKTEASEIQPWDTWNVVMLDAESKLNFYLQLPPTTENFQIQGMKRGDQTTASLLKNWPIITNKPVNTIFISRKMYAPLLQAYFSNYHEVQLPQIGHLPFVKSNDGNAPIAFIPNK